MRDLWCRGCCRYGFGQNISLAWRLLFSNVFPTELRMEHLGRISAKNLCFPSRQILELHLVPTELQIEHLRQMFIKIYAISTARFLSIIWHRKWTRAALHNKSFNTMLETGTFLRTHFHTTLILPLIGVVKTPCFIPSVAKITV